MYIVKPQCRGGERTAIENIGLPPIVDFSEELESGFLSLIHKAIPDITINYGHATEGIPFYPLECKLPERDMSGFYLSYLAGTLPRQLIAATVTKCMVKALANTWIAEAKKIRADYNSVGKLIATVAPADTISYANTVARPIYGWLVMGKIELETSVRFDIVPV